MPVGVCLFNVTCNRNSGQVVPKITLVKPDLKILTSLLPNKLENHKNLKGTIMQI